MKTDLSQLPSNLPQPKDDGAAKHLCGLHLPDITLKTSNDDEIHLAQLLGVTILFIYPMTGRPGIPLPDRWDDIPGARGCTPQSCAFRDLYNDFQQYQTAIYGISTQSHEEQKEAKERLHLPYDLLSDEKLQLKNILRLPTFKTTGVERYKRLTLVIMDANIVQVFYPVFPPDKNADDVLKWLIG